MINKILKEGVNVMESNTQILIASLVFILTYAVIISEKIHRAVASLLGAAIVVLLGILNQEEAIHYIDFNTIGLLTGMMIIVGIAKRTGMFEYLAVKAAKMSKGDPVRIMFYLSIITATISAFLDNVTTVLLIVPVTFTIAEQLDVNPVPFLIAEVLSSNIGGTATLIGDPPNIMIGSATGLGFMDFVINLTPIIIVIEILTLYGLKLIYRKQLVVEEERKKSILTFNENEYITDPVLLKKSIFVILVVIFGFVLHQFLHLESATIALAGATLLLLISRVELEGAFHEVEWPVLFFFVGLFIVVGALDKAGVLEIIARESLKITGGKLFPTSMIVLWLSAIASAFVDNIPFVATMIPLIQKMGHLGGITNLDPLWWSLSLGACLGGNGTIIGASANVVVAGMAERKGIKMTFAGFMKVAFPLMIMSIVVSMAYIIIRYFIF